MLGMVVVIRYEGPKGGPGMPEMLTPTSAIMGAGLGNDVAMVTDGRFSGGSHGFIIGHVTPEAQVRADRISNVLMSSINRRKPSLIPPTSADQSLSIVFYCIRLEEPSHY